MQTLAGAVGRSDFGIITASRVRSLAPAEKICLAYVAHYTVLPPGVEYNQPPFRSQTRDNARAPLRTRKAAPAVTRRRLSCKILTRYPTASRATPGPETSSTLHLGAGLSKPGVSRGSSPLSVAFPYNVEQLTEIRLPHRQWVTTVRRGPAVVRWRA